MRLRDTVKMKLDPSRLAGYAPEGRAQPVAVSEPRSLTASAEQIKIRNPDDVQRMRNRAYKEWQRDSWAYYDAIGEIKYGFNMFAAVLSRIRLFAAVDVDPDSVPTSTTNYRRRRNEQTEQERTDEHISEMTVPPAITDEVMEYAERLVKELFSGHGGISGFMKTFALNMSVAGECYLVKIRGKWFIRSTDEIEVDASGDIYMRTMRNGAASSSSMGGIAGDVKLPKGTPWIRIWRDHPRYSEEPDSSMLGILEPCEELITIQRMVRSIARKQMNNGILGIPEDLSVAGSTVTDDVEDAEEQADELASTIYDNFTDPVDDETASSNVVPTILVGSVEAIKGIMHIPVEKAVDDWLPNRADRALERILQGLDMPKDFVTGLANVRYCVDTETEALTRAGWKKYNEITTNDQLWTINPNTGLGEWQYPSEISTFHVENELMYRTSTRDLDTFSTDDHRWYVRNGKSNEYTPQLTKNYTGGLIPQAASAGEFPDTPKYSDDFVELMAWLYTEGSFSLDKIPAMRSGYGEKKEAGYIKRRRASISQSSSANLAHYDRIRALLARLYGEETAVKNVNEAARTRRGIAQTPQWRALSHEFHMNEEIVQTFETMFVAGTNKALKRDFFYELTRSQLELFVKVSVWGDGSGDGGPGSVFCQKDRDCVENFELACQLLGWATSRRGEDGDPNHCVSVRIKKNNHASLTPKNIPFRREEYTGVVWCPTTTNGTWFARRNNTMYFTGNTNAKNIDESLYKSHIEPMALMLCDSLQSAYFRPLLSRKFPKLTSTELDYLCVWYDPSEIVTKADPAESADKGHEKMILSDDAWRAAHGFSDADAPNEEELALRLLIKASLQPEQIAVLFSQALPAIIDAQRKGNLEKATVPMPESAQSTLFGKVIVPTDETAVNGAEPTSAQDLNPFGSTV